MYIVHGLTLFAWESKKCLGSFDDLADVWVERYIVSPKILNGLNLGHRVERSEVGHDMRKEDERSKGWKSI
jgi:hypothetical protein